MEGDEEWGGGGGGGGGGGPPPPPPPPHGPVKFTLVNISKLSTDNISIRCAPCIITDSAPGIVVAKFNTSFISSGATSKSDITIGTSCECFVGIYLHDNDDITGSNMFYLSVASVAYHLQDKRE